MKVNFYAAVMSVAALFQPQVDAIHTHSAPALSHADDLVDGHEMYFAQSHQADELNLAEANAEKVTNG